MRFLWIASKIMLTVFLLCGVVTGNAQTNIKGVLIDSSEKNHLLMLR
jgi:hypothetical protein